MDECLQERQDQTLQHVPVSTRSIYCSRIQTIPILAPKGSPIGNAFHLAVKSPLRSHLCCTRLP